MRSMSRWLMLCMFGLGLCAAQVWAEIPDTQGKRVYMELDECFPTEKKKVGTGWIHPPGGEGMSYELPWGEATITNYDWFPPYVPPISDANVEVSENELPEPHAHAGPWEGYGEAAVVDAPAWAEYYLRRDDTYQGPPIIYTYERDHRLDAGYLENSGEDSYSSFQVEFKWEMEDGPQPWIVSKTFIQPGEGGKYCYIPGGIEEVDVELNKLIRCSATLEHMGASATSPSAADARLRGSLYQINKLNGMYIW